MTHMETTQQVLSRKLVSTFITMFDSCPIIDDNSKDLFATACEIVRNLLPKGDECTLIDVPTPAATVMTKGVILLSFAADQIGSDDVKRLLLDIVFQSNHQFSLNVMKNMKEMVDNPEGKFSFYYMLTSEPKSKGYELN